MDWAPAARRGRRRGRRRLGWLRRAGVGVLVVVLAAATAVAWLFSTIELPSEPVQPQASVLLYADGVTQLARVGIVDRSAVSLERVPEHVRYAVLAAEDRAFYSHAGVSAKGVLRALWANVSGGGAQGASTITQQYVRNAYLTLDQTVRRKVKEMVLAVKVERRDSKDTILERYLNTVYFGRGAYGIEAASRAYFGVGVERLTVAQGVVLAAVIKDPTELDPGYDPDGARSRWRWIIRAMVGGGWLDGDAAAALAYPAVAARAVEVSGPVGHIVDRVEHELKAWGVTAQVLRTAGLRITTTIDLATQRAVVDAARTGRDSLRRDPDAAVVAVEPRSGAVRGYYAGEGGRGFFDNALAARPPGRLFQPVVLAEALSRGIALGSRWNGRSPQYFADRDGVALHNWHDRQCGACRLDEALRLGTDTVLYAVAERVGPGRVAQRAHRSGVSSSYGDRPSLVDAPNEPRPGRTRADVALGRYPVSVADLASVYATFAAAGRYVARHFVAGTRAADGSSLRRPARPGRAAMPAAVAADVSSALATLMPDIAPTPYRMSDRFDAGLAGQRSALGRRNLPMQAVWSASVAIGDTGGVASAWCARYVPELAVVGWLGHDPPRALAGRARTPAAAATAVCGRVLADALAGRPVSALPPPAYVGRTDVGNVVEVGGAPPTGSPGPTPAVTTTPSPPPAAPPTEAPPLPPPTEAPPAGLETPGPTVPPDEPPVTAPPDTP